MVFPTARCKIFLTVSVEARAQRRLKELQAKGVPLPLAEAMSDICSGGT